MSYSYIGRVFLCFEWSTREKRKHQKIFFVFMPYMWMCFFAVNASCHTHECHTHEWVRAMSHIWMSECFICHAMHVTRMNKGVRVFISQVWMRECFSSLWMSRVTHMNEEASENVFQVRTSDRTKELWWDDRHADLCRHAARSCSQKSPVSLQKSHISPHNSPISLPKSPRSLHKSPIPLQTTPATGRQARPFFLQPPPPPCYGMAASIRLSEMLGLFLKTSPISRRALSRKWRSNLYGA